MIDSKHSWDNYKNLKITWIIIIKITTVAIIKDTEMLKFVLDHLKTVNMCKHAVKKLPFVIKYVPDCLKTKEMCDKVVLEHGGN